jgi:tetratricopeptide (TPR) repeat protein
MTEEERVALEEERDFLLSSLRDLEREREVGDIDDVDYATLKSSYTKRTADILRLLARADEPASAEAPEAESRQERSRWRRRYVALGLVGVLAVGLGVLVARNSGQRLPGATATGGLPDTTASKLAQARQINFQDPIAAIRLYSEVLKTDPDNVEALTYRSWLLALTAQEAEDDVRNAAIQTAIIGLGRATLLDEGYPDAHCFLGIVSFRFANDIETARTALAKCQESNPPADVRGFVDSVVAEIQAAG